MALLSQDVPRFAQCQRSQDIRSLPASREQANASRDACLSETLLAEHPSIFQRFDNDHGFRLAHSHL
jgi:hypothetical protein